jgi:hypothetical protein
VLPNYESQAIDIISRGDAVTRLAIGEGWTKITYTKTVVENDEEKEVVVNGYVNSKYISATNPTVETVFEKSGMSITLGVDFKEISYTGVTAAYETEKILVVAIKETFESLVENGFDSSITLEEYAALVLEANGFTAEVKTEDGLTYYVYSTTSAEGDFTTYASVYKSEDAFWFVQFVCAAEDYASLEADIVNYAKSVTFKTTSEL